LLSIRDGILIACRFTLVGRAPPDFLMRVAGEPGDWLAVGSDADLPTGAASGDEITITGRRW